jgi:hypothetical protein
MNVSQEYILSLLNVDFLKCKDKSPHDISIDVLQNEVFYDKLKDFFQKTKLYTLFSKECLYDSYKFTQQDRNKCLNDQLKILKNEKNTELVFVDDVVHAESEKLEYVYPTSSDHDFYIIRNSFMQKIATKQDFENIAKKANHIVDILQLIKKDTKKIKIIFPIYNNNTSLYEILLRLFIHNEVLQNINKNNKNFIEIIFIIPESNLQVFNILAGSKCLSHHIHQSILHNYIETSLNEDLTDIFAEILKLERLLELASINNQLTSNISTAIGLYKPYNDKFELKQKYYDSSDLYMRVYNKLVKKKESLSKEELDTLLSKSSDHYEKNEYSDNETNESSKYSKYNKLADDNLNNTLHKDNSSHILTKFNIKDIAFKYLILFMILVLFIILYVILNIKRKQTKKTNETKICVNKY